MTISAQPKRRAHRRGQALALSPTGARRATAAAQRQCCICRAQKVQAQLLQLGPVPGLEGDKAPAPGGRHSYVCIASGCLRGVALRLAPKKTPKDVACSAFVGPLMQLATTRVTEVIGLARRQGLLVMGASRIIEARPKRSAFEDRMDAGDNLDPDLDGIDDIDDDDDDEDDDDDRRAAGMAVPEPCGGPRPVPPTETVVHGGPRAPMDVFCHSEPNGAQDVVLLAADAAVRTARRLGPTALPCMLHGAAMGHAAGGAPVAAVGFPSGRLALQAAYWLQVWYEARAVLTTPESMLN